MYLEDQVSAPEQSLYQHDGDLNMEETADLQPANVQEGPQAPANDMQLPLEFKI